MAAHLTADDVRKVARLARLKLSEPEVESFTRQLGQLLEYVEVLSEVDTAHVEPLAHAIDVSNVMRNDEPVTSLSREAALQNAPQSDGRYFLVPPILEGG